MAEREELQLVFLADACELHFSRDCRMCETSSMGHAEVKCAVSRRLWGKLFLILQAHTFAV